MSDDVPSAPTTDPLDEEGGRALVEAWRASGQSGAAFCRIRGLRPQRLHYWRERLGYPIKVLRAASVPTSMPMPAPEASGFVQMVVRAPSPTTNVEIMVGGTVIRVQPGFDAAMLRSVVSALRGDA
jgi:hypothetical protein